MTGIQLKEWANKISDEAVVLMRESGYNCFKDRFDMQAVLTIKQHDLDAPDVPHE